MSSNGRYARVAHVVGVVLEVVLGLHLLLQSFIISLVLLCLLHHALNIILGQTALHMQSEARNLLNASELHTKAQWLLNLVAGLFQLLTCLFSILWLMKTNL